jgi:hypothetical protein
VAGIADGASLLNANDLTIGATTTDTITTTSQAGSAGGIAISPSVAITIANITTKALIGTGSALSLDGQLTMTATQTAKVTETNAKADAAGSGSAAIGASLALGLVHDVVETTVARSLTADGDISLNAVQSSENNTLASASAKGAKDKDQNSSDGEGDVNKKGDDQLKLGNDRGTSDSGKGASGGSDKSKTTDASTGDKDGGSSKVQVAAAVAIDMLTTSSQALFLGTPAIASTSGKVSLRSSANTDAKKTKADGTTADASTAGIAAAVAINDIHITNRASTGQATVTAANGLTVEAGMRDVSGNLTHEIEAEANSGATASDKVSVAGALALNIVHNNTEASVGTIDAPGTGHVTLTGGNVSIQAVNTEKDAATAKSNAEGGEVGVGASVALNILPQSHTRAEVEDGSSFSGTGLGTVTVKADSTRTVETEVEAGSAGDVSVTPAVALVLVQDDLSRAHLGSGAGSLTGGGALSVEAKHTADYTKTVAKAEAAGDTAAIGADLAIVIMEGWQTSGELARNVTAGSVQVLATSSVTSNPEAHASAKGGDSSDKKANEKADDQTANNSNVSSAPTTNTSQNSGADANSSSTGQSGGGGSSVGIAASVVVNIVDVSNTATIGNNATVNSTGLAKVSASTNVDAKARADSTAVDLNGSANIAAAFSLNSVHIANTAKVGTGANVTGAGITVEAITPDTNDISARALSVAGNKGGDVAVAGVFAINVVDSESKAFTADGSHLHGGSGPVNITARHDLRT